MVRLENWRCKKCGAEKEIYIDTNEEKLSFGESRCDCGYVGTLEKFNFKNNGNRYRYLDSEEEDYDEDWD